MVQVTGLPEVYQRVEAAGYGAGLAGDGPCRETWRGRVSIGRGCEVAELKQRASVNYNSHEVS